LIIFFCAFLIEDPIPFCKIKMDILTFECCKGLGTEFEAFFHLLGSPGKGVINVCQVLHAAPRSMLLTSLLF